MTWELDKTHSEIGFAVKHMMISTVRGKFAAFVGKLDLTPDALETSQASATVEVASIDTGEPKRDEHLKSGDFFDVEKFPKLTFKTRSIAQNGDKLRVVGELTIRDVTREVTLDGTVEGPAKDPWGNQRIGFSLTGELQREDFGLGWNQVLEAGGVLVGKKVKLSVEAQVVKK